MLVSAARCGVLGFLAVLGILLGFSSAEAGRSAYDDAVGRSLRLLPRQPKNVMLVERSETIPVHQGQARAEAFVNQGGQVVYLVRQGVTLQATLKGPGIFDYVLAIIIWHEMAHIDGADEATAQRAEEQLWAQFVLAQRVDPVRGIQYLALLKRRR
jgi:hypothetical protein